MTQPSDPPPLPYAARARTAGAPVPPPLSAEQLAQLSASRVGSARIRRAVSIARFDGMTLALFAVATIAFGLTSPTALAMGVAIGVIAIVELLAADRLRALNPSAARTLGFNQLALAATLIIYSLVQIARTSISPTTNLFADINDPEVQQMLQPYSGLYRQLSYAVYGGVIVVALLAQGSLAWYYFSRRKYVIAHLAETPTWVTDLRRATDSM